MAVRPRIVSGVLSTLSAVNHKPELAGIAGEITATEAAALLGASIHPALRRLVELRLDPTQRSEDSQPRGE